MADPTRPEPQKIDPTRPGSKIFDPDPSLDLMDKKTVVLLIIFEEMVPLRVTKIE